MCSVNVRRISVQCSDQMILRRRQNQSCLHQVCSKEKKNACLCIHVSIIVKQFADHEERSIGIQ